MKGHKGQTIWAYLTFTLHRNDGESEVLKDENIDKVHLYGI